MTPRVLSATIFAAMIGSGASAAAADLVVPPDETSTRFGELVYETVRIQGTLRVKDYDGSEDSGWLYLRANRIVIEAGALIDGEGKGFTMSGTNVSAGPGAGSSPPDAGGMAQPGGGGGHTGQGGDGQSGTCTIFTGAEGGAPNDSDAAMPLAYVSQSPGGRQNGMGSAGGSSWAGPPNPTSQRPGSDGGGVIILEAGHIEIHGEVNADGGPLGPGLQGAAPGGGAGGSIVIRAHELTLGLSGRLYARGAAGGTGATYGGGGGGGLIALFTPGDFETLLQAQASVSGGSVMQCSTSSPAGTDGVATHFADVECLDADGDGAAAAICGGSDCNDGNLDIGPGVAEICNGVDDDCDGVEDDEDDGDLCSEGSGHICLAGSCTDDPDASGGSGPTAPAAVPEVELGGGLCSSAAPGAAAPIAPFGLGGLLFAGAALRRIGQWSARRRNRIDRGIVGADGSIRTRPRKPLGS